MSKDTIAYMTNTLSLPVPTTTPDYHRLLEFEKKLRLLAEEYGVAVEKKWTVKFIEGSSS